MKGWIKLWRDLREHDLWLEEKFTRGQAWLDMLMMAAHRRTYVRIRGIRINLEPGQLALSEVQYARRWQWSRGKVRRFLAELEQQNDPQIIQQKNNVTTVVTISKWNEYQGDGTAESTADNTPNDTANGQQMIQQTDTDKNGKNGKNAEEIQVDSDESTSSKTKITREIAYDIVKQWNELAAELDLPQVKELSPKRKKGLNARYKQGILQYLPQIWEEIRESEFLQGIRGRDSWKGAHFNWLFCSPNNWVKVIEGQYREGNKASKHRKPQDVEF